METGSLNVGQTPVIISTTRQTTPNLDHNAVAKLLQGAFLQMCNEVVAFSQQLKIMGVITLTTDESDQDIVVKINNTLKRVVPDVAVQVAQAVPDGTAENHIPDCNIIPNQQASGCVNIQGQQGEQPACEESGDNELANAEYLATGNASILNFDNQCKQSIDQDVKQEGANSYSNNVALSDESMSFAHPDGFANHVNIIPCNSNGGQQERRKNRGLMLPVDIVDDNMDEMPIFTVTTLISEYRQGDVDGTRKPEMIKEENCLPFSPKAEDFQTSMQQTEESPISVGNSGTVPAVVPQSSILSTAGQIDYNTDLVRNDSVLMEYYSNWSTESSSSLTTDAESPTLTTDAESPILTTDQGAESISQTTDQSDSSQLFYGSQSPSKTTRELRDKNLMPDEITKYLGRPEKRNFFCKCPACLEVFCSVSEYIDHTVNIHQAGF